MTRRSDRDRPRRIPGVTPETEMCCHCEAHMYLVPWAWVRDGQGVTCGPYCDERTNRKNKRP